MDQMLELRFYSALELEPFHLRKTRMLSQGKVFNGTIGLPVIL